MWNILESNISFGKREFQVLKSFHGRFAILIELLYLVTFSNYLTAFAANTKYRQFIWGLGTVFAYCEFSCVTV